MHIKCHVSWGLPGALTEDPDYCINNAAYAVYLDCNHGNTISYKKKNPGFVCVEHVAYLMSTHYGLGICGCHWIIIPVQDIINHQIEDYYYDLAHELNKKYLRLHDRICLCCECADR